MPNNILINSQFGWIYIYMGIRFFFFFEKLLELIECNLYIYIYIYI